MSQPSHAVGARRASPLAAVRQVWPMAAVVTLVGLVLGIGYASSRPVTYTAESRVAVGTGSLSAVGVAGYTVGVDSIAADYARSVTSSDALTRLGTTFGAAADQVVSVNASPLPSSAVIRVDVAATSSDVALRAVTAVTSTFVTAINKQVATISPAGVLTQYQQAETRLLAAQTQQNADQGSLAALRNQGITTGAELTAAQAKVNADAVSVSTLTAESSALNLQYQSLVATPPAENGLRNVQSAALIGSNRRSILERYALLGLAVGALLALAGATWLDRRRVARSRGTEPFAAAAPEAGRRGRLVRMTPASAGSGVLPAEQPARALPSASPSLAGDPYLRQALRAALEQQTRQQAEDLEREIERRRRTERDAARAPEGETGVDESIEDLLPWTEPDLIPGSQHAADRERRRAEAQAKTASPDAFFAPPQYEVEEPPAAARLLAAAPDPVETDRVLGHPAEAAPDDSARDATGHVAAEPTTPEPAADEPAAAGPAEPTGPTEPTEAAVEPSDPEQARIEPGPVGHEAHVEPTPVEDWSPASADAGQGAAAGSPEPDGDHGPIAATGHALDGAEADSEQATVSPLFGHRDGRDLVAVRVATAPGALDASSWAPVRTTPAEAEGDSAPGASTDGDGPAHRVPQPAPVEQVAGGGSVQTAAVAPTAGESTGRADAVPYPEPAESEPAESEPAESEPAAAASDAADTETHGATGSDGTTGNEQAPDAPLDDTAGTERAAAAPAGVESAERQPSDDLAGDLEPRLRWPRRHGIQPRKVS